MTRSNRCRATFGASWSPYQGVDLSVQITAHVADGGDVDLKLRTAIGAGARAAGETQDVGRDVDVRQGRARGLWVVVGPATRALDAPDPRERNRGVGKRRAVLRDPRGGPDRARRVDALNELIDADVKAAAGLADQDRRRGGSMHHERPRLLRRRSRNIGRERRAVHAARRRQPPRLPVGNVTRHDGVLSRGGRHAFRQAVVVKRDEIDLSDVGQRAERVGERERVREIDDRHAPRGGPSVEKVTPRGAPVPYGATSSRDEAARLEGCHGPNRPTTVRA
jgi:hypothetical protein